MLKKYALIAVSRENLVTPEFALRSESNMERFKTLTAEIKRVAPKSNEFVYFVSRAIHAMETANLDPVTKKFSGDGHIAKYEDGKCSVCNKKLEKDHDGLWHSASGLAPYVNQNGDAFPESELLKEIDRDGKTIKAFETFVGRGLFVNHASDDAEKIRGIILDAAWDPETKGVDLLVACDRVAYPELARQIEMGYSNDVSMGTQVSYSLCSKCGNKAAIEQDYCDHVRHEKGLRHAGQEPIYEINYGLNFIELSVVSTGADPKAKIKTVLAMLSQQVEERESKLNSCINPIEAEKIRDELGAMRTQVAELLNNQVKVESVGDVQVEKSIDINVQRADDLASRKASRHFLLSEVGSLLIKDENPGFSDTSILGGKNMSEKKAYFQGGGDVNDPDKLPYKKEPYAKVRDTQDKQMVGEPMETGSDGMHPGDEKVKESLCRASIEQRRAARHNLLQKAYFQGGGEGNDPDKLPYKKEPYAKVRDTQDKQMVGEPMETGSDGVFPGDEKVKEDLHRASAEDAKSCKGYFQGGGEGNDPDKLPYKKEPYAKVRDTQDKQMVGEPMETGSDGVHPGDEKVKEDLCRAKLRAKFVPADKRNESTWTLYAGATPLLTVTASQLYGSDLDKNNEDNPKITNWDWVASRDYGKTLIKAVKQYGFKVVKAQIDENITLIQKEAQLADAPPPPPEMPAAAPAPDALPGEEMKVDELAPEGLPMADEMPAEEKPLSEKEQVLLALDRIESAIAEIRALNDGESADVESLEGELELEESHNELEDLGEKMEMAKSDVNVMKKVNVIAREAVSDAMHALKKVAVILETRKVVKAEKPMCEKCNKPAFACECSKEEKKEEKAEEKVEEKKAETKVEEKKAEEKKEEPKVEAKVEEKKEEKVEEKKEEKKALDISSLLARKAARYKMASEIYNVVPDSKVIEEAHPETVVTKAGGVAVEGDAVVENVAEQQKADIEVAEKQPRGEVVAATGDKTVQAQVVEKAMCEKCKKEVCECKKPEEACMATVAEEFKDSIKTTADLDNLKVRMKRAYKVALRQAQLGQIEKAEASVETQVDRLITMDDAGFQAFEAAVMNTEGTKEATAKLTKSAGVVRPGLDAGVGTDLTGSLSKLPWK